MIFTLLAATVGTVTLGLAIGLTKRRRAVDVQLDRLNRT